MWKRDAAELPPTGVKSSPARSPSPSQPPVSPAGRQSETINIGRSVAIKGELKGSEDLTIDGHVEGTITLKENTLTVGPNGKIAAQVFAKVVVVEGHVHGNISAGERVDIRDHGSMEGDIVAPRIGIAEGALFRGSIDMQPAPAKTAGSAAEPRATAEPRTGVAAPSSPPPARSDARRARP